MSRLHPHSRPGQHGMVLVSSLLLLLVVTILAVSMFRGFGLQEKIAGDMREKQRALHSAGSAQQYAEWWLSLGNGNAIVTCTSLVTAPAGQVCQNKLYDVVSGNYAKVPWMVSGTEVGVKYTPPTMNVNTTSAAGTYYQAPRFYISYLGLTNGGNASVYQIDAVGYGGSPDAVAVVESTYMVSTGVKDLGGL